MKYAKLSTIPLAALATVLVIGSATSWSGCAKKGVDGTSGGPIPSINLPNGSALTPISGPNVMQLTVDGSTCNSGNLYQNKPCVSVTICPPGASGSTSSCQTISDILLDTGSYGLRVFSSVLNATITSKLQQIKVTATGASGGSTSLAECATFETGSDWGPVMRGAVMLGGEPGVTLPIHVINSTFSGGAPASCGTPDTGPSDAGFNGILGVGLFGPDCGQSICGTASSSWYYSCTGTTCTPVALADALQVTNPVSMLPVDNNGVILELPSIAPGGVPSIDGGYFVMGIGTAANNIPNGVVAYAADQNGEFTTVFNGVSMQSFVDSGSNALYFSDSSIADCGSPNTSWFCPGSTIGATAVDQSATISGLPQATIPFLIGDTNTLLSTPNNVFLELAGDMGGQAVFDWGLPFYIGRNIYVGIDGKATPALTATGPFWAF